MSTLPPETSDEPVPLLTADVPLTANGEVSARDRLAQSRQRISVWLEQGDEAPHDTNPRSQNEGTQHPVAAILIDVLSEWWRHHPLYTSATVAGVAARNAIVPLVRRHPIVALGVAAITGAVLMRSRAWRWVVKPAVVAGLASQIVARAVSQMQSTTAANPPDRNRYAAPPTSSAAPPAGRAR